MIKIISNAAGETMLLFRLDNGWTAAALPDRDGRAKLLAWPGYDDAPGKEIETGPEEANATDLADWIDWVAIFEEVAP